MALKSTNEDRFTALFMNKRIHLQIERAVNHIMLDNGITASQGHILMFIIDHSNREIYSTEIHQKFGISRATVSGLVKKLRARGYVEYKGCEDDERHKSIAPTEKAFSLKKSLDDCMESITEKMFCDLSDEEISCLINVQSKLLKNAEHLIKEEKN